MILENQNRQQNTFHQNCNQSVCFTQYNSESPRTSELGRIRNEYKNQIRIRDIQRMKSQRRKALLTNQTIQQILGNGFPKQSDDARNWAFNLIELFQSSNIYEPDAHRLREVFLVAQRFPCLGTLKLFYLFVLNASTANVETLFDMDIWKFLHNILQFPNLKPNKYSQLSMNSQNQNQLTSNNVNTKFVEVEMVQSAIQTLILFYKKSNKFRDFSIHQHKTFKNYIIPSYKKYQEQIKTEIISYVKGAFFFQPTNYSDEYKLLVKIVFDLALGYKDKFSKYFIFKSWKQLEMRESLIEVIQRSASLMETFYRVLTCASNAPFLSKFIEGIWDSKNFCHLSLIDQFLEFGQDILPQILFNDNVMPEVAENCVNFIHQTIYVFQGFTQYSTKIIQNPSLVPSIMKRIVWVLYFLQKCDQKKVFNNSGVKLLTEVSQVRRICFFVIDNALNSQFDKFSLYIRNITFFELIDGTEINLLQIINYSLKTQYKEDLLSEIYRTVFSYLKQQVQKQDIPRFYIMKEMIETIIHKFTDIFTTHQAKMELCYQISQNCNPKAGSLGKQLRISEEIQRHFESVEEFMNNQKCDHELLDKLESVRDLVKQHCENSHENTLII